MFGVTESFWVDERSSNWEEVLGLNFGLEIVFDLRKNFGIVLRSIFWLKRNVWVKKKLIVKEKSLVNEKFSSHGKFDVKIVFLKISFQ